MRGIRLFSLIAIICFCFLHIAHAQVPVEVHTNGNAVSNTNPLPVSGSMTITGGATEVTQLLIKALLQGLSDSTVTATQAADILTQLLKLKFTGENLKVVFSNSAIGATQSGIWNINSITTLPNVTIGSMPAVTANNLDIRDLSSTSDSVKVEGGNSTAVKVDGSAVTQPISASSLPLPSGAATAAGISTLDNNVAKETTLLDIKTTVEAMETRLDDLTLPETGFTERFEVNGYAETSKSYENISHIEVYVQTADKVVRMALFGNDTTTNYVNIDKTETPGWVRSNVRFPVFDMNLKGNTETDTAIVVVQGWQYTE
jgi:hypothetical protein